MQFTLKKGGDQKKRVGPELLNLHVNSYHPLVSFSLFGSSLLGKAIDREPEGTRSLTFTDVNVVRLMSM